MPDLLATALPRELSRAADPGRALAMQAYMKSAVPFLGVGAGPLRALFRRAFADFDFPPASRWRRAVLRNWRGARYREEHYGAIELAGDRRALSFQTLETLPMCKKMIATGAWWDPVDAIATKRMGFPLRRYPGPMRRKMLAWSRSRDLWKRRSALLCQIGFKGETDRELLYGCIEPSLRSREFFLRKAIGWALRQYAWTDPKEVARYVRARRAELSPLSRREALKKAPVRVRRTLV
jgi:3-methyladenine DNA glycosylase AlkD